MIACDPVNTSSRLQAPENCKDDDVWSDGCNACRCISKSKENLMLFQFILIMFSFQREVLLVPEKFVQCCWGKNLLNPLQKVNKLMLKNQLYKK